MDSMILFSVFHKKTKTKDSLHSTLSPLSNHSLLHSRSTYSLHPLLTNDKKKIYTKNHSLLTTVLTLILLRKNLSTKTLPSISHSPHSLSQISHKTLSAATSPSSHSRKFPLRLFTTTRKPSISSTNRQNHTFSIVASSFIASNHHLHRFTHPPTPPLNNHQNPKSLFKTLAAVPIIFTQIRRRILPSPLPSKPLTPHRRHLH